MTAKPHPAISVVIPAFNAGRYIAESLESVRQQRYPAHESIVVDDGSSDDTAMIAKSVMGVRCIAIPHGGIGAARNAGVQIATGDLLAFLDADDRWEPDKLAWQVQILVDEPTVDMVFGHVLQFLSPDLDEHQRAQLRCVAEPQPGLLASAMLVRAEAFRRVGGFDTTLSVGEFVDWHSRATDLGLREWMLPDVVLHRRLHGGNTVLQQRDRKSDYLRVVKAALDRRRRAERGE
jgi:glycosyltransferase involved in cell wall biosynthesis